jgi:hypothetical protein
MNQEQKTITKIEKIMITSQLNQSMKQKSPVQLKKHLSQTKQTHLQTLLKC